MILNNEFFITISILSAAILVVLAMILKEKRPKAELAPSLIPTTPVMYVAGLIALLAGVHLLNLFGVQTGR